MSRGQSWCTVPWANEQVSCSEVMDSLYYRFASVNIAVSHVWMALHCKHIIGFVYSAMCVPRLLSINTKKE